MSETRELQGADLAVEVIAALTARQDASDQAKRLVEDHGFQVEGERILRALTMLDSLVVKLARRIERSEKPPEPEFESKTGYNAGALMKLQEELVGVVEIERLNKSPQWYKSVVNDLIKRIYQHRVASSALSQVGWAKLGTYSGQRYVQGVRYVQDGPNDYYAHPIFIRVTDNETMDYR